jgi:hypothetical protein
MIDDSVTHPREILRARQQVEQGITNDGATSEPSPWRLERNVRANNGSVIDYGDMGGSNCSHSFPWCLPNEVSIERVGGIFAGLFDTSVTAEREIPLLDSVESVLRWQLDG